MECLWEQSAVPAAPGGAPGAHSAGRGLAFTAPAGKVPAGRSCPCYGTGDLNENGTVTAGDAQRAWAIAMNFVVPTPAERFVDAASGNLRLSAGSPSIDRGHGDLAPDVDLDLHARCDDPDTPNEGFGPVPYVDLGAYEYRAPGCE